MTARKKVVFIADLNGLIEEFIAGRPALHGESKGNHLSRYKPIAQFTVVRTGDTGHGSAGKGGEE